MESLKQYIGLLYRNHKFEGVYGQNLPDLHRRHSQDSPLPPKKNILSRLSQDAQEGAPCDIRGLVCVRQKQS